MNVKVQVEYFTDPLCPWSYVSEPTVQGIISEHGDKIDFHYRSLPILDAILGQPRPGQKMHTPEDMQKEWVEVSEKTKTRVDPALWRENPPHSSWPANRAMKAALKQGFEKGNRFIYNLREAIMHGKRNPSNLEVLQDVAKQSGLDVESFHTEMTDHAPELEQAVADDRLNASDNCIFETPTLVMRNDEGDKVIISGTLDYEVCTNAIRSLMGEKVIGTPEAEVAPSI